MKLFISFQCKTPLLGAAGLGSSKDRPTGAVGEAVEVERVLGRLELCTPLRGESQQSVSMMFTEGTSADDTAVPTRSVGGVSTALQPQPPPQPGATSRSFTAVSARRTVTVTVGLDIPSPPVVEVGPGSL